MGAGASFPSSIDEETFMNTFGEISSKKVFFKLMNKKDKRMYEDKIKEVVMSTTDCFLSHNWGENQENHNRVKEMNKELQALGLRTWFDEEQMEGNNIRKKMADGIEFSRCMVVFITLEYLGKVDSDGNENCQYEFQTGEKTKGAQLMFPVVQEKALANTSEWFGEVVGTLGNALYVPNFEGGDVKKAAKELYKAMMGQLKQPVKDILPKIEAKFASSGDNSNVNTRSANADVAKEEAEGFDESVVEPLNFQDTDGNDNVFVLKQNDKLEFNLIVNDELAIQKIKQLAVYSNSNGSVAVKVGGLDSKGKLVTAIEMNVPKRHGKNVSDKLMLLYSQYYATLKCSNVVSFQDTDGDQVDFHLDEESNTIFAVENDVCVLMPVSSLTTSMKSNGSCLVKYSGTSVDKGKAVSKCETTVAKRQANDAEAKLKKMFAGCTTTLYNWVDPEKQEAEEKAKKQKAKEEAEEKAKKQKQAEEKAKQKALEDAKKAAYKVSESQMNKYRIEYSKLREKSSKIADMFINSNKEGDYCLSSDQVQKLFRYEPEGTNPINGPFDFAKLYARFDGKKRLEGAEDDMADIFRVYDVNGDGVLDENEVNTMVEGMIGEYGLDWSQKDVLESAILQGDMNKDSLLNVDEMIKGIQNAADNGLFEGIDNEGGGGGGRAGRNAPTNSDEVEELFDSICMGEELMNAEEFRILVDSFIDLDYPCSGDEALEAFLMFSRGDGINVKEFGTCLRSLGVNC